DNIKYCRVPWKSILGWQSKKFKIKARKIPRKAAYLAVREIPRDGSATQISDFLRSHQVLNMILGRRMQPDGAKKFKGVRRHSQTPKDSQKNPTRRKRGKKYDAV
ncbi:MAG: hypothetical protein KGY61_13245, partial [Desulfobacterales bacterium]|nr:hypothetical protein [Desulfobacterales bacterium]